MTRSLRSVLATTALLLLPACGSHPSTLITVDAAGAIAVNGEPIALTALPGLPALEDADVPIHVRVNPETPYKFVDALQKALQEARVTRIVFEHEK